MSPSTNSSPEHPPTNNYLVLDLPNEELIRLQLQDLLLTASMGGVLPEQPDPTIFQRVLDAGCASGTWLIDPAESYPSMVLLVGVDINTRIVELAQRRAQSQGLSKRVQFRVMDARRLVDLPDQYFDLVNQRMGMSYLQTRDWPQLLHEYQRVTRPGGIIRFTESEDLTEVNSPALRRFMQLLQEALYQAGYLFTLQQNGSELVRLLLQAGLQQMQTRAFACEFRAGTPEGYLFLENIKQLYRSLVPFLRQWTPIHEDHETLYQHLVSETQQIGFRATWNFLTMCIDRLVPLQLSKL